MGSVCRRWTGEDHSGSRKLGALAADRPRDDGGTADREQDSRKYGSKISMT